MARTRRNPKKVKAASRPQYYRIKRIVDMVREGSAEGYLPSSSDFRRELEVSPRTLARDLDFLRDEAGLRDREQ
jgi:predicted DNA-binding transcriptional regulator YafY